MKKLTAFPPIVDALSVCATHAPAQGDRPATRIGHRPSAPAELQQFTQAWNMSTRQVIAILVYIRTWLHNLLMTQEPDALELSAAEAAVLLSYARWLDGFPQVVRRLPDAVLLADPVPVHLTAPALLPPELQGLATIQVSGDDQAAAAEQASTSAALPRRRKSNAQRLTDQFKQVGSFVNPSMLAAVRPADGSRSHWGRR